MIRKLPDMPPRSKNSARRISYLKAASLTHDDGVGVAIPVIGSGFGYARVRTGRATDGCNAESADVGRSIVHGRSLGIEL